MKQVTITLYEYSELKSFTAKLAAREYVQSCLYDCENLWIDDCDNQLQKLIKSDARYTHQELHDICYSNIGICHAMDFCDQFNFEGFTGGKSILQAWMRFSNNYLESLRWDECEIEDYSNEMEFYFDENGKIWSD